MLIDIEQTHNPNVQNFYLNTQIFAFGNAEYANTETASTSEFAQNILQIGGIREVLILPDMIFVQKEENADFNFLSPQIMAEIVDYDFSKFKSFDFSSQNKMLIIKALTEALIRPFLKKDGGDIEISDFQNGILHVNLQGRCKGCPHALQTLQNIVATTLKKYIFDIISIYQEDSK